MPFSPNSPSLVHGHGHRRRSTLAFETNDAVEALLADAVVGNFKYVNVMMTYRAVSARMRYAIDCAVDRWCNEFVLLQRQRICHFSTNLVFMSEQKDESSKKIIKVGEEYFKVVVQMEKLIERAFGSCRGMLQRIVHLSKMDRPTYYSASTRRCVLCGDSIAISSNIQDAENTHNAPCYVFAHLRCQRKHTVTITSGETAIPNGTEPRELHNELRAVARMLEESSPQITVSRQTVVDKMSEWYKCNALPRKDTAALIVWLRPHSRVNPKDTLYGAFGVTRQMIEKAAEHKASQWRAMREQSEAKRMGLSMKMKELTETYEAELRVWLGKGKTRWRSIEDLEVVHDSIMSSSHIDRLIDPSVYKCGNASVSVVCNSLHIFSKTMDHMENGMDVAIMDWLVRCLTISSVFGVAGHDMQYVERSLLSVAISNEAKGNARALSVVQNMTPQSIESVKMRSVRFHGLEANYHFSVSMRITELLLVRSAFSMTHSEVCKLKYKTSSEMGDELAAKMPPLPLCDGQTEVFLLAVIRLCFSPNAGMARSLALERLMDVSMFREIMLSLSLVSEGGGAGEVQSDMG